MRLFLLFAPLALASCSGYYQYYTISGENMTRNQATELVAENDTLRITYRFYIHPDQGDQLEMDIVNKTNEPIELNWKRSSLILDEEPIPYYDPTLYVQGEALSLPVRNQFTGQPAKYAFLRANIQQNADIVHLPPHTTYRQPPVTFRFRKADSLMQKNGSWAVIKGEEGKAYRFDFAGPNSPVRFRNYLSFRIGANQGHEFFLDHSFYANEIWQTKSYIRPSELKDRMDVLGL